MYVFYVAMGMLVLHPIAGLGLQIIELKIYKHRFHAACSVLSFALRISCWLFPRSNSVIGRLEDLLGQANSQLAKLKSNINPNSSSFLSGRPDFNFTSSISQTTVDDHEYEQDQFDVLTSIDVTARPLSGCSKPSTVMKAGRFFANLVPRDALERNFEDAYLDFLEDYRISLSFHSSPFHKKLVDFYYLLKLCILFIQSIHAWLSDAFWSIISF